MADAHTVVVEPVNIGQIQRCHYFFCHPQHVGIKGNPRGGDSSQVDVSNDYGLLRHQVRLLVSLKEVKIVGWTCWTKWN